MHAAHPYQLKSKSNLLCVDYEVIHYVVFSQITVTLRIENTVSNPIPASFITTVKNGTVLVDILNKAAKENKRGPFKRYESTYFGGLGYLITAINGTKQDLATSTFWLIFDDQSGGLTPCGVSSYVPADNSITIFRFTQYSPSSGHGNVVSGFCKPFPSPLQVRQVLHSQELIKWSVHFLCIRATAFSRRLLLLRQS